MWLVLAQSELLVQPIGFPDESLSNSNSNSTSCFLSPGSFDTDLVVDAHSLALVTIRWDRKGALNEWQDSLIQSLSKLGVLDALPKIVSVFLPGTQCRGVLHLISNAM